MGKRLKEALNSGKLTKIFGLGQMTQPKFVEMIGLMGGYDAVWLDQEHPGITIEQIEQSALAARATGIDSFVRLAATDYATVMRPLEAGAGGVMAAQVRSVEEAKATVRWAKFPPDGERGWNGLGVDAHYGLMPDKEYFVKANAETFIAIQIEHYAAADDVENIAAIPGVDVLFVGPSDLSLSMGVPGQIDHPKMKTAIERVAAAAKKNGINWAIVPPSPEKADEFVEMGCRCLAIGFDTLSVIRGVRAVQKEYGKFFK